MGHLSHLTAKERVALFGAAFGETGRGFFLDRSIWHKREQKLQNCFEVS
jgi:hypothetical protein